MRRNAFAFVLGFLAGVVLIHVLEGPLDMAVLRRGASDAIEGASTGARDLALATEVRAALALHKEFGLFDMRIDADSGRGRVTLSGQVGSSDQRRLAELISRGVNGVEEVVNDLEVHRAPEPTSQD